MMHTLVKKHIMYFVVALLILGIGVVGMWRFATLMHAKKEKVITAKQAITSYEENKKIFADESVALASIGDRATVLEQYRITASSTPELLSALEDLAKKNSVDFAITSVQTPGTANAQKLTIDFSAKGTATFTNAFLRALSHQTYQVKFTKFSLFADTSPVVSVSPSTDAVTVKPTAVPAVTKLPQWEVLASIEIVSF